MIVRILVAMALICTCSTPLLAQDTPSPADFLIKEGKRLRDAKELESALAYFEAAAKLDPKNANALMHAAWIANENGDHDKAMQLATAATKLDAENSDAWAELGYAQLKMKQYLRATKSLQNAIDASEDNWSAYDYLAMAYREGGVEDEALAVEALKKKKMGGKE